MVNNKVLLWIVGILLITALTVSSGFSEIATIWRGLNPLILVLLGSLQILTLSLSSFQWYYLFNKENHFISFKDVFSIYLSGVFVESVTPSSKFGGEATKVYLFRKKTGLPYQKIVAFFIAHKYISLLPFLVLCSIFLILGSINFNLPGIAYISFGALALLFSLIAFSVHKGNINKRLKISRLLDLLDDSSLISKPLKKILAGIDFIDSASAQVKQILTNKERNLLLVISVIIWGLYPLKIYLAAEALGIPLNPIIPIIATYLAYLVSMLPLSPGGLGTFEGTMAFIFSVNGISFTQGVAISMLARSITYWFPLFLSAAMTIYLIKVKNMPLLQKTTT